MIIGFGATSPATGDDCPAQGSWESWCDCMWPVTRTDPTTNGKCRVPLPGAPWTILGANLRGIPHASGLTLPAGGGDPEPGVGGSGPAPSSPVSVPMLVGGGILLAGGLAYFLKRRKK